MPAPRILTPPKKPHARHQRKEPARAETLSNMGNGVSHNAHQATHLLPHGCSVIMGNSVPLLSLASKARANQLTQSRRKVQVGPHVKLPRSSTKLPPELARVAPRLEQESGVQLSAKLATPHPRSGSSVIMGSSALQHSHAKVLKVRKMQSQRPLVQKQ